MLLLSGLYENGVGRDTKRIWTSGLAEIVRVLDYIIRSLSGKYFQADPLEYCKQHSNGENKNRFGLNYRCVGTEESREGERGEEQRRRDPNENWNT
jgi:hypothetical protein